MITTCQRSGTLESLPKIRKRSVAYEFTVALDHVTSKLVVDRESNFTTVTSRNAILE